MNKSEAFNGFTKWVGFDSAGIIQNNNREQQRKIIKYNHLVSFTNRCHPPTRRKEDEINLIRSIAKLENALSRSFRESVIENTTA